MSEKLELLNKKLDLARKKVNNANPLEAISLNNKVNSIIKLIAHQKDIEKDLNYFRKGMSVKKIVDKHFKKYFSDRDFNILYGMMDDLVKKYKQNWNDNVFALWSKIIPDIIENWDRSLFKELSFKWVNMVNSSKLKFPREEWSMINGLVNTDRYFLNVICYLYFKGYFGEFLFIHYMEEKGVKLQKTGIKWDKKFGVDLVDVENKIAYSIKTYYPISKKMFWWKNQKTSFYKNVKDGWKWESWIQMVNKKTLQKPEQVWID